MAIKVLNIDPQQTVLDPKTEKLQTLSFRRNDYESSPDEDTFEKKNNTVKKVAISTAVLLGLAVIGDFLFAEGKHVKKIFGKAEKDAKKAGDGKKPENKPKTENKPKESTNTEEPKKSGDTKKPEDTKKTEEPKKQEEPKSPEGAGATANANNSSKQSSTLFEFEHDGNRFVVSENREIVSYKNAQGEELIEKYRNPESEGDKIYKATIDEALNKRLAERDSKIAEENAKKAAEGKKPEETQNDSSDQAPENAK